MMIIQADLTNGNDFGMFGKLAQGRAQIGRRFHCLGRVPADGGINGRKLFCKTYGAFAAAQTRADGNHFGDTGGLGAGNDLREILFVVGIIEMRVRVVKRRHKNRVER